VPKRTRGSKIYLVPWEGEEEGGAQRLMEPLSGSPLSRTRGRGGGCDYALRELRSEGVTGAKTLPQEGLISAGGGTRGKFHQRGTKRENK